MEYTPHENTFLHVRSFPKTKPQVGEIKKLWETTKPKGEARAGIKSLSLWAPKKLQGYVLMKFSFYPKKKTTNETASYIFS